MNGVEFFPESELYLPENESEVRESTSRSKEMKSKSLSAASRSSKFGTSTLKVGHTTLKPNKGVSWLENNPNLQQGEEPISKGVSEATRRLEKPSFTIK